MRVALDATPLAVPKGGTARYVTELEAALRSEYPDDEFPLLSETICQPAGWMGRRWWLWGLNRELARSRVDVFHGTAFQVPYLKRRPTVMTLLDLSPWRDPQWHHDAARVRRRTPWLLSLRRADIVLTLTQAVRQEAMARFRLQPERVLATPLAASSRFRPVTPHTHPRPYFLCVATIEPRKNVPLAIAAWREVRRTHAVDLILAGRRRADGPEPPALDGLHWLGAVEDEELPALYSGAVASLYPSLYEGFGLPLVEAMRCGTAVIASRDPAAVEVCGGVALHCDAQDARAWVQALTAVVEQPETRALLARQSLRRAADFSWRQTARLTYAAYEEARRRYHA